MYHKSLNSAGVIEIIHVACAVNVSVPDVVY